MTANGLGQDISKLLSCQDIPVHKPGIPRNSTYWLLQIWKGDDTTAPHLSMNFQDFCLVLKTAKASNFYTPEVR